MTGERTQVHVGIYNGEGYGRAELDKYKSIDGRATGWAGIFGLDIFVPDVSLDNDTRRRYLFGGAHWTEAGAGRFGVVVSLVQQYGSVSSQLLSRRLQAQTHIEF